MAAINIDAELIQAHQVVQKEEKVVKLQNGCICCTLRQDLLEEVAQLAEKGEFDYLVIESTGISEPIQVAETFTTDFAEKIAEETEGDAVEEKNDRLASLLAEGGLSKIAKLDTCVTVVSSKLYYNIIIILFVD